MLRALVVLLVGGQVAAAIKWEACKDVPST